jgi:hypothetical protein
MGKDPRSMERADTRWQLDLRTVLRAKRRWAPLLALLMVSSGPALHAAPQHFAVAIPALEGPVTMGIFSEDGKLVRLLYRDAPVETIPSGLNGLIMTWDGKDDQGLDVPAGTYRARGLVHGPLRSRALPCVDPVTFPPLPEEGPASPFPADRIVLRAAEDELLESRPLLSLRAVNRAEGLALEAEGLPLVTIPLIAGPAPAKVLCNHGSRAGAAVLAVERGNFRESYVVLGLDRIVPMEAGKLEVSADASHPAPNAGESAP